MKLHPTTLALALLALAFLALPFVAAAADAPDSPAADSAAAPAVSETPIADAVCAVTDTEAAVLFAPGFLKAQAGSSCTPCASSAECQPICGGQIGFDFACHYNTFECGRDYGRVCICF